MCSKNGLWARMQEILLGVRLPAAGIKSSSHEALDPIVSPLFHAGVVLVRNSFEGKHGVALQGSRLDGRSSISVNNCTDHARSLETILIVVSLVCLFLRVALACQV
jgi:hypothetical protein